MGEDENVTNYLIRAETICNSLKTAGENISDSLLMAITMNELPDRFNTFCTVMTQKDEDYNFLDYKIPLKSFKENERYHHGTVCEKDTIMQLKPRTSNPRRNMPRQQGTKQCQPEKP